MPAFSGEFEGGVNNERRHFKLNRFSWGTPPSNFLPGAQEALQECALASSLYER